MTHPETVSFREFADIIGMKPSWVTQLKAAGRLVLTDDGKRVKTHESLKLIEETRDLSAEAIATMHAARRGDTPSADVDDDSPAPSAQPSKYHESRAERESWEAKSAQLKYEREIGKLLDAADVEAAATNAATVFRKSLDNLPHLIAVQAAGKSELQIRELVAESLNHALADLAREFNQLAKVKS